MKPEATALEKPSAINYLVAIAVVTSLVVSFLAVLVAWNLRLNRQTNIAGAIIISVLSLMAAWLSIRSCAILSRKITLSLGIAGAIFCATVCGWVFYNASFQLTAASYPALNAARVPADLIAELKGAEGIISDNDQQFVADLSTKLGQDHIAPYRDALVQSCWNCHQRLALAALAGFCACFSLTVGASLGSRSRL